jgi:TetR/AcrR family transcriptional regulator, transcriptional repressor of bet genes
MATSTSSVGQSGSAPNRREEAKERRRIELIEATIDSIARRGFSDTTLADVADRAGLSRGIVNFYFKSKDVLFADTLRHLADEYRQTWGRALSKAGDDPARRLRALLMVNFDPRVFSRKKIAVWYAFWGEAKSRPAYLAVCAEKDREYRQALDACVSAVVAAGNYSSDPAAAVRTFDAVTDGFWLDRLTDPDCPEVDAFIAATDAMLATYFPRHFRGPEQ